MERPFIRYIYRRHCKMDEDPDKVNEIEKTVKSLVHQILDGMTKQNPLLEISKMIESGSFYEKTKVGAPDEFDFMVILKHFSEPGCIILEDGCNPWYKKIHIQNQSKQYKTFLESEDKLSIELLPRKFWGSLLIICKYENFSQKMKYGTMKIKECKNRKLRLEFIEHSTVPYSDEDYNTNEKTDCKDLVHMPTMEIGVDLMLAIEYPDINEVLTSQGFPDRFTDLVSRNGCHLVAKNCQSLDPCSTCWHVSLSTSELNLMRDMDEKHKQSYQVLKYLLIREVSLSGKCANLSSYMLKNAFLFHVYETGCVYTRDVTACIHTILDYLSSHFRKGRMPCFLSRNIDTWGPIMKFPVLDSDRYPSRFGDDGCLGVEWYGVCWLELWRRVVLKVDKLFKEVTSADDKDIQDQFYLMKESMMLLIECYCKHTNIQQLPTKPSECNMPSNISDSELSLKFEWYYRRLAELFDLKLGDLISL